MKCESIYFYYAYHRNPGVNGHNGILKVLQTHINIYSKNYIIFATTSTMVIDGISTFSSDVAMSGGREFTGYNSSEVVYLNLCLIDLLKWISWYLFGRELKIVPTHLKKKYFSGYATDVEYIRWYKNATNIVT